jgi:hypothetical protein
MTKIKKTSRSRNSDSKPGIQDLLQRAQLHAEKCELKRSCEIYHEALEQAKRSQDLRSTMEAISGLLRLSNEALDESSIERWDGELDRLMLTHPRQVPPLTWYCKGAVARRRDQLMLAQRCFHRYLRACRAESQESEGVVKGWLMLATVLQQRNRLNRSLLLMRIILSRYESKNFRSLNGAFYILLGINFEKRKDFKAAMRWYQKAHAQFLGEHNWFYHLYVLYGYARLARHQQNFSQAYWFLDLVEKAIEGPEFALLRKEIGMERNRLDRETVDLLIDSHKGVIQTRECGQVFLRKQYVLLHILEALSHAHRKPGKDFERGLSKAEIIEYVWKETYSPEAHDNKLYYNINRLRKLIEPDVRKPQYLLNWKEGYRLAPSLRVQYVGDLGSKHEGEK